MSGGENRIDDGAVAWPWLWRESTLLGSVSAGVEAVGAACWAQANGAGTAGGRLTGMDGRRIRRGCSIGMQSRGFERAVDGLCWRTEPLSLGQVSRSRASGEASSGRCSGAHGLISTAEGWQAWGEQRKQKDSGPFTAVSSC